MHRTQTMSLSIIICTHNPRQDYLRRVLDSLQSQTLPKEQWELLLIDNASQEPLSGKWDLSWHPRGRHVHESVPGLTPARLRGIRESAGELLAFVDDDNVLEADYLAVALDLAAEHARLGCFGAGILAPEFERDPAPELTPYTGGLALRTVAAPQWSNTMTDAVVPWGAGLVVRRVVAEKYAAVVRDCPIRRQLDRCGSTLNSGGDDEFSWIACGLGYGKGLFPALKVTHLIDRRRVEKQYLLTLAKGHGFSQTFLEYLHGRAVYYPPRASKFSDILSSLLRARVSTTLNHANSWWCGRHKPAVEREFDDAWRAGVDLARSKLAEFKSAGTFQEPVAAC